MTDLTLSEYLSLDATRSGAEMAEHDLQFGTNVTPDGKTITVTNKRLYRDGVPWLPVMGEFHYSRLPRNEWDEQLRKMKSAGISIVSSYVIWQHHQHAPGHFDFSGDLDLRAFIALCAKHKLLFFLRPGPWVHAEVRFGGLPDFVVERCFTRSNDPEYLGFVSSFFRAISEQTAGLLWKDGGPIVGLQIENEYNRVGALQGRDHIAELKRLLVAAGLDVPLYTVTGWDNAVYPEKAAVPVFGSYVDEPWATARGKLPPKSSYAFLYGTRSEWGLGAVGGISDRADADRDLHTTPFLGAEYGAGVPTMYRRRPLIAPEDITAMVIAKLGSGINLLGYYMFQGGRNPAGSPSREENTAIGGFNDLARIGYDFQAPLGQYGQAHDVLRHLSPIHAFLGAFGDRLALTDVCAPDLISQGADDLSTLRWSVRSDGKRGYLFVNNYVRQYRPGPHRNVIFSISFDDERVVLPPVDIDTGDHFIWPLNFDLSGINMRYATAQPVTKLTDVEGDIFVFLAPRTDKSCFAFSSADNVRLDGMTAASRNSAEAIFEIAAGYSEHRIEANGLAVRVIVLPGNEKDRISVLARASGQLLILSDAHVFEDENKGIALRQTGRPEISLSVCPDVMRPNGNAKKTGMQGAFARYTALLPEASPVVHVTPTLAARAAPIPNMGGPDGTVLQPHPEAFGAAARWRVKLPDALPDVANTYLRIDYLGDMARLFAGDQMIDDHLFDGRPWEIGLHRFAAQLDQTWELAILPLPPNAPIAFDEATCAQLPPTRELAELRKISLVVEYGLRLTD